MTKQENGVKMLRKLLEGVKTLDDIQFDYSRYVSEQDSDGCGTVCCFIGWAPRFIPEIGYKWGSTKGGNFLETTENYPLNGYQVAEDFGLPLSEIDFMFYADPNPHEETHEYDRFGNGWDANLEQVINRVEYILERYEN